eukprot:gene11639-34348_t
MPLVAMSVDDSALSGGSLRQSMRLLHAPLMWLRQESAEARTVVRLTCSRYFESGAGDRGSKSSTSSGGELWQDNYGRRQSAATGSYTRFWLFCPAVL